MALAAAELFLLSGVLCLVPGATQRFGVQAVTSDSTKLPRHGQRGTEPHLDVQIRPQACLDGEL